MIPVLGVAVAIVLARYLLAGSSLDVDPQAAHFAPAILALAVGVGLVRRARLHVLAHGLALALLAPARPWCVDLVHAGLPRGMAADVTALALSLLPVGFVLGRMLSLLLPGGLLPVIGGWLLAEVATLLGFVTRLPGPFAGLLVAGLLAGLVELGRHRRQHRHAGPHDERVAWELAPLGLAFTIAWLSLRRIVPSYATPPVGGASEVLLALLLPACLVAWPASVLAEQRAAWRRPLSAAACLVSAFALWKLASALGLYLQTSPYVSLSTELRQVVGKYGPPVTEWRAWLVVFSALVGAALGLQLGGLRKGAAGPLVVGLGLGGLAEAWVLEQPFEGPQQLLLAAAGVAALVPLGLWRPWAALLTPVGVLLVLALPEEQRASFEAVRRVGEPAVESFERTLMADVQVFSAFGPDSLHPLARRAYRQTFTERCPLPEWYDLHGIQPAGHAEEEVDRSPAGPPLLPDDEPAQQEPERHLGVRVGGVPLYPDADPLGEEGCVGRLLRLFGRPGDWYVTGLAAELLAGDALDAGLAQRAVVSSPVPLGERNQRVLLVHVESRGVGLSVDGSPRAEASVVERGRFSTVVVAPAPGGSPGEALLTCEEHLGLLAELLAPGGRCLQWLETASLDRRALQARVAAFAGVFGERSAALVEMRGLGAPLVLLVGWRDEAGQPRADQLAERLPWPDTSGTRSRLDEVAHLGAMLLRGGPGMLLACDTWTHHARATPVLPGGWTGTGWAAVRDLIDPQADLSGFVLGAPAAGGIERHLVNGLVSHGTYVYEPDVPAAAALTEAVRDVDWMAFEVEVGHYVDAAVDALQDPLLHQALASLLEPLAMAGDYGRFARVFEQVGAISMDNWRLAALHARVLGAGLQESAAAAALARARRLAPWDAGDG